MCVCVSWVSGRAVEDVLMAACTYKSAWDGFTKPQRKSINQWKDAAGVRPHTHTHTHTVPSLSLYPKTHTHTHSLSLSLIHCLPLSSSLLPRSSRLHWERTLQEEPVKNQPPRKSKWTHPSKIKVRHVCVCVNIISLRSVGNFSWRRSRSCNGRIED